MSRLIRLVAAMAAVVAVVPVSAGASISVGHVVPPESPYGGSCGSGFDALQPTTTSGPSYVMPETGSVTSWTTHANDSSGMQLTMKVFRKIGEPSTYRVVAHDGPRALVPAQTAGNTFAVSVPVNAGDVLGLYAVTPGVGCDFPNPADPTDSFLFKNGNLADGESAGPFTNNPSLYLNIGAVLEPSNALSVGAIQRNKKKGTATITADLPNPGTLALSGAGVKSASSNVSAPGAAQVLVKAAGKKKRKLAETGKVSVAPVLTYTPTGGAAKTQSLSLKLRRR